MMSTSDKLAKGGIKSAVELAMERLDSSAPRKLSDAQRDRAAEIESRTQACIAELKIMHQQQVAAAQAMGQLDELALLTAEMNAKISQLRDEEAAQKDQLWEEG